MSTRQTARSECGQPTATECCYQGKQPGRQCRVAFLTVHMLAGRSSCKLTLPFLLLTSVTDRSRCWNARRLQQDRHICTVSDALRQCCPHQPPNFQVRVPLQLPLAEHHFPLSALCTLSKQQARVIGTAPGQRHGKVRIVRHVCAVAL